MINYGQQGGGGGNGLSTALALWNAWQKYQGAGGDPSMSELAPGADKSPRLFPAIDSSPGAEFDFGKELSPQTNVPPPTTPGQFGLNPLVPSPVPDTPDMRSHVIDPARPGKSGNLSGVVGRYAGSLLGGSGAAGAAAF